MSRVCRRLLVCVAAVGIVLVPALGAADGRVELDLAAYDALRAAGPVPEAMEPAFVRADVTLTPRTETAADVVGVDVEIRLTVRTYTDGESVAVLPADALVLSVVGEGGALPLYRTGEHVAVRLERAGVHGIDLKVQASARRSGGEWLVVVPTPTAPATTMHVGLRGPHDVTVDGNAVYKVKSDAGLHIYGGAAGGASVHELRFRPRADAPNTAARVLVTDATLVSVRDGLVEGRTTLDLEIQGPQAREVTLEWSAGLEHVEVVGDDVLAEVQTEGGRTLTFSRPVGTTSLSLRYEVLAPGGRFQAPQVRVRGADRQHGAVAVEVWGGTAVAVNGAVTGARSIDEEELPAGFPGVRGERRFAWRYFGAGHQISLVATRYERQEILQVAVQSARVTTVWTRQGTGLSSMELKVLNNADQFLRLRLPSRVELWSTHVDSHGVHPVTDGEWVMVPLRKSRRAGESLVPVSVELVLHHQGDALGAFVGHVELALPRFELVLGSMDWEVFLPEGQVWHGVDGWDGVEGVDGHWVAPRPHEIPGRFVTLVAAEKEHGGLAEAEKVASRHRGALPVRLRVPKTGHRVAVRRNLVEAGTPSTLRVSHASRAVLHGVDIALFLLAFLLTFSGLGFLWSSARGGRLAWRTPWPAAGVASVVCMVGILAALPVPLLDLGLPLSLGAAMAVVVAVGRLLWGAGRLGWEAVTDAFSDDDIDSEYSE